jgi:hypothetical protein
MRAKVSWCKQAGQSSLSKLTTTGQESGKCRKGLHLGSLHAQARALVSWQYRSKKLWQVFVTTRGWVLQVFWRWQMQSRTILTTKIAALPWRSQKVFEEKVNLLVRFWSWRMTLAVSHGNPIRIPEKSVDCNRMIKSFPTLRPIF